MKCRKIFFVLLMCGLLGFSSAAFAAAYENAETDKEIVLQIDNPFMTVNGLQRAIDDGVETAPLIRNGRTLVPVRAVVEAIGGDVDWDADNHTVMLSYADDVIKLTVDCNIAYLNDIAVTLETAPEIMNERTMLPIRFIAESFGFRVEWREAAREIVITGDGANTQTDAVNHALLSCIGKTKAEITKQYGDVVDSEYRMGGKYYIHNHLQTQFFYENSNDVYDYGTDDDAEDSAICLHMIACLSEVLHASNQTVYTPEELQAVFGSYEFVDDLDNDFYPACYYRYHYGDYDISIESDGKNPEVQYVYIFKKTEEEINASSSDISENHELTFLIEEQEVDYNTLKGVIRCCKGETLVWEHETNNAARTELETLSDLYEDEKHVYYICDGKLNALDKYTGELIWQAEDAGASNSVVLDDKNIYVSGYYGPNLVVLSKENGTELYRNYDDFCRVYDIKLQGTNVILYYDFPEEGSVKTIDISTLK